MNFRNAEECWKVIQREQRPELLSEIEKFARENEAPATIVFGTSGWRGEIGTDFTFDNVRIVTQSIITTLKNDNPELRQALGIRDFDDVKRRGIIVGHDNRFLGRDFAMEMISMLAAEGIKVLYAGETITPEFSTTIEMLGAACSINITPSHNPSNYLGLKFNPSDGGPAGPEITNLFQDEANRLMGEGGMGKSGETAERDRYEEIDTICLYIRYLEERGTLDLKRIRDFVRNGDCLVVIDHVHGATRGRPERLLKGTATDIMRKKVKLLRTEDNYLFGGVAPEPSAKNMEGVEEILKESAARFKIGVIMDPDGDRIRFADHTTQISMNYFGAMALHFLHVHKGLQGVAAKSVGTSNFVNAIAEKHGIPLKETSVGFKNFRPFMLPDAQERAIVAFEESDGISGYNHTLEKDALFGLLLAIEMVATTGKNLGEYLNDLMDEYGHYYPDRSGIEVARSLAGEELSKRLSVIRETYPVGSTIQIGDKTLKVAKLITVDGTKIVLEDGSWLMIRPSGTEPKVRFYIEARTVEEKEAIFKTAERLTQEAIEGA
ncbi:MAG: phosphomannomutase [Deltaproteobacteria bacterium]|nr:phosphomannomutase [Deltaproteobacteria bacterium]